jgi:hypothetical protein
LVYNPAPGVKKMKPIPINIRELFIYPLNKIEYSDSPHPDRLYAKLEQFSRFKHTVWHYLLRDIS